MMCPPGNTVKVLTIHSAKGLEFENVFLIGLEEGIFPHKNSFCSSEDLEEERRLCYVAITRAKKNLWLVNARRRLIYGDSMANPPSRFLEEIDKKYLNYRLGNLAPMYEPIIFAMKPYKKTLTDCVIENDIGGFNDINGKIPSNIIECDVNKVNLYHETEKPIELIEYLIKLFSINENHVILDFTMGSGTTGVACKNLNRSFIGIELNKKYFEIAKTRIEVE